MDKNDVRAFYRSGLSLKKLGKLDESWTRLTEGVELAKNLSDGRLKHDYIQLKNEVARGKNAELEKVQKDFANIYNPVDKNAEAQAEQDKKDSAFYNQRKLDLLI